MERLRARAKRVAQERPWWDRGWQEKCVYGARDVFTLLAMIYERAKSISLKQSVGICGQFVPRRLDKGS